MRAICATRSRRVGMPSKRSLPLFFGIATCRTGNAVNVPSRSEERSSSRNASTPMSSSTWRRVTASTPAVLAPRLPATRSQATNKRGPVADQVEQISEPACPVRPLPIGAACAGDRVLDAPPNTGPSRRWRRYSTTPRHHQLAADHAAALPHARSFPALGVLRRLRHDPMPTAGVTPAHRPGWMPVGQGGTGSLPTFTDVRSDGVGAQLYPGGIATGRTSQSWPGPPAAQITQTTRAGRSKATTCPAPQSDPSTRFTGR